MSERSHSFLKRFKTERQDYNNHVLTKTPKCARNKTHRHHPHTTKIQLTGIQQFMLNCSNHPYKKATFQLRDTFQNAFCHECSIRLVKNNVGLLKLSEKSLSLRAIYQAQMEKIHQLEEDAHSLIADFFEKKRAVMKKQFNEVKQNEKNSQSESIMLPTLTVNLNKGDGKIKENSSSNLERIFGKISYKSYEFVKVKQNPQEKQRKGRILTMENLEKQNIYSFLNISGYLDEIDTRDIEINRT